MQPCGIIIYLAVPCATLRTLCHLAVFSTTLLCKGGNFLFSSNEIIRFVVLFVTRQCSCFNYYVANFLAYYSVRFGFNINSL